MENKAPVNSAVYPGTFDPITNGHLDIIRRALHLFPRLFIAVASSHDKAPLFGIAERLQMIKEATKGFDRLTIEPFDGLLVDYLRRKGAGAIIRGVRAVSDFDYEFQMALMNRKLNPRIETLFLMPSEAFTYLSSSLIKEVARHGGDISGFVPDVVLSALRKRLPRMAP